MVVNKMAATHHIDADESEKLKKWERSLVIVSMPHSAALGAFLGRYEIKDGADGFLSIMLLASIAPLITLWLFCVHDLLRNAFLRMGHYGKWIQLKHRAVFLFVMFLPLMPALILPYIERYADTSSIFMISMTLLSWVFIACKLANDLYVEIVRPLGVKSDD